MSYDCWQQPIKSSPLLAFKLRAIMIKKLHTNPPRTLATALLPEKVGVSKIKIRQLPMQTMAVLGSFAAADQLLKAWANGAEHRPECEFEIQYLDGAKVSGIYPITRGGTARQSLSAHLQRTLAPSSHDGVPRPRSACAPMPLRFSCAERVAFMSPAAMPSFLVDYDVTDG